MIYIRNLDNDPAFNLALEQFVFESLDRTREYFLLWQNDNAIIVGRYQNTEREINQSFVRKKGIRIVRRISGGGAVYHDLGNLNYTFICDRQKGEGLDFDIFCSYIVEALAELGVKAYKNGRNDLLIEGRKFSGCAQYFRGNRVLHHGTLLFDSNLQFLSQALSPPKDKIESKGIKSVTSRVTNIRPFLKQDIPLKDFWLALECFLAREKNWEEYQLNANELAKVQQIKRDRYDLWEWNHGSSPSYNLLKERRVEGCGKLEFYLQVNNGVIKSVSLFGDFFGAENLRDLCQNFIGCRMEYDELLEAIKHLNIREMLYNVTAEDLVRILIE